MSLRVDELFSGEDVQMPNLRLAWLLSIISFPLSFLGVVLFTTPLGLICAICSWLIARNALTISQSGFFPNVSTTSIYLLLTLAGLALLTSLFFMVIFVPTAEDIELLVQFFSWQ